MATTDYWLYVGNTAPAEPRGIFVARFHAATGELSSVRFVGPALNPNFLALHPNGRILYAVTAGKLDRYEGAVEAFAIDPLNGRLQWLNRQPSGGGNPAHLAIDPTGRLLVAANYDGATVAAFPLRPDGRLSPATALLHHQGASIHPQRQTKPFPHGITFDPTGRFLFVPDLGADRIFTYAVDAAAATLQPAGRGAGKDAILAPGSGPRHLTLAPGARFACVINELTSTITVFACSPDAALREVQTLAPWAGKNPIPNTGAEIALHPNGRWLYASNRGYDSIVVCSMDQASGTLAVVAQQSTLGKIPRHFAIDPAGQFLIAANLRSQSLVVFHIDSATGALSPTGVRATAPDPLCLVFVPADT